MSTGEDARLDPSTGERLVAFARSVVEAVATDEPQPDAPDLAVLAERRGTFVTLKRDGALRGCIGRPRPEQPLETALREAARGAATSDPRFRPLSAGEVDAVTVSVSVLTPFESLIDADPDAIEVGRDGLVVSRDGRRGLLLPQVAADRDWDAERFLAETCRKAGLPPDAWEADRTTVERFSAQVFAEESPRGPVTVEEFTRRVAGEQPTD